MQIVDSKNTRPVTASSRIKSLLETITEAQLREWIQHISVPRHFQAEAAQNRATAKWLCGIFESLGFRFERQGRFDNIVAFSKIPAGEAVLVGAHYDSVPECPGADDNGSAVAAMLGCAAACSLWQSSLPVVFVAFNREEDGLAGSRDFVASYLPKSEFQIRCAHVLEMVGFASTAPGSQRVPPGLPVKVTDKGDFLGLVANQTSNALVETVLRNAATYRPDLPVMGLKVRLGMEQFFPVLKRSDHVPFWARDIPSIMWTDTSEFRNPNYHRLTDTPETLNYPFLRSVTQLLTAQVIDQAQELA